MVICFEYAAAQPGRKPVMIIRWESNSIPTPTNAAPEEAELHAKTAVSTKKSLYRQEHEECLRQILARPLPRDAREIRCTHHCERADVSVCSNGRCGTEAGLLGVCAPAAGAGPAQRTTLSSDPLAMRPQGVEHLVAFLWVSSFRPPVSMPEAAAALLAYDGLRVATF